jgi:transglutaminase-like putative cysteine protease
VLVHARRDTGEPDVEAGRARSAIERGLREGALVEVVVGDEQPTAIADVTAGLRWAALVDLGPAAEGPAVRRWRRRLPAEPETSARPSARWWAAAATLVSLVTLNGALGYGPLVTVAVTVAVLAAAAVSARSLATGRPIPAAVRAAVGLGALASFVVVAAGIGPLTGLLSMLRGPLPQVLVILVLLHGFECRDRRTIRVGLGISAVVLVYAAGFRVDDSIGWWLLAWTICFGLASSRLALPTHDERRTAGRFAWPGRITVGAPRIAAVAVGGVATLALLAVVPVPDGPARLTLPTFISDSRDVAERGAIAGPDGDVRGEGDTGDGQRTPPGQAGGYTGFAQSMDTSVRGELGDEVVMRVRAPEPDFWRGQTFSRFDGRLWHADEETGVLRQGPNIDIPPAFGDTANPESAEVDRFVQTFYVEQDLPNVLFAAYRPVQAIVDADVWTRPDGALRATTVLPKGSIYTIVSARTEVTADRLRSQGLIGGRLTRFGRQVLEPYLALPESTTPETIALAESLAEGAASTYDVVRAYERWLSANVDYDLHAPLPDEGEDAVHDFLFDSQRGFCEQISSALAIMLRSQGVPTRVATGYAAGVRDRIAGVYEVRASDAHAWVEVWFPETGWQAFDPTASVPLSGDVQTGSVGADLLAGVSTYVEDHRGPVVLVIVAGLAAWGAIVTVFRLRRRRRRGRWGVLQDRYADLALARGVPPGATNLRRADGWTAADDAAVARLVAAHLDRVAFDPTFEDDDADFETARRLVETLGSRRR